MRLGLIGNGAIAQTLLSGLAAEGAPGFASIVCLARAENQSRAAALIESHAGLTANRQVVTTIEAFIASGISLAVECAGQPALREFGERILAAGIDLVPASIGAFADDALHDRLVRVAETSGARLILPAGAVGGLDILGAAKLSGIQSLLYTSRKPPVAWRGTAAEQLIDLGKLTQETVFYEGTARAAARDYPKNANVAAAVALAGLGFDRTQVRLIADPFAERNVHEISLQSSCANMTMRIEGLASAQNPQTSLTTGFSIARVVLNQIVHEVI